MKLKPISFRKACDFVTKVHRHHKPPRGHKFSISVVNDDDEIIGVAIVGRPVSRVLDDGFTAEVIRLATDGTKNACSMLYGASWRASKGMGYTKIVTYILESESGVSLRASGWSFDGMTKGGRYWKQGRSENHTGFTKNRTEYEHSTQSKQRWIQEG